MGLGKVRFLKKYRCVVAGTECAALSSSLDAQHFRQASIRAALSSCFDAQRFRQVSMAQHFHQVSMRSTFVASLDAPTRPTMHSNTITVVSEARTARNLCLASAACKTCNDGHTWCSSFCLANYGISSPLPPPPLLESRIGHVQILCTFRLLGKCLATAVNLTKRWMSVYQRDLKMPRTIWLDWGSAGRRDGKRFILPPALRTRTKFSCSDLEKRSWLAR